MKAENAWQAALGQLEIEMPKASFDTWVRGADLLAYEDGAFFIGVRNTFAREWLDSRLTGKMNTCLSNLMGRSVSVNFVVWQNGEFRPSRSSEDVEDDEDIPSEVPSNALSQNPAAIPERRSGLNSKYTFESFVVGASNRMAHAASLAVAERPAQAYNPLFLYGGVGLGKTHLIQAIGNLAEKRGLNVLYVSSEDFMNDLIQAIRTQTTSAFRERYRSIDLLLIDDIQFIIGKESTQEEFFHTFNTLYRQNKQIVLTSDRPPKAMNTLEERLRSRFEWGLTADIQYPDYETRLVILNSKAERAKYTIPQGIAEHIARKVQSNIRELEGALTRIMAYSSLFNEPLTHDLVDNALADLLPRRKEVQPEQVVRAVAETYNLPIDRLLGRNRSREVSLPRQIAMYLLREDSNCSLPQIGQALGGRDHTTVLHGCEKVAEMMETDDKIRREVVEIRQSLYGNPNYPS